METHAVWIQKPTMEISRPKCVYILVWKEWIEKISHFSGFALSLPATQHLKKRLFFSIKGTIVHGRTGSVICRVWSKMRMQDPLLKSCKESEDNESIALSRGSFWGAQGDPPPLLLEAELGTDKINWEDRSESEKARPRLTLRP